MHGVDTFSINALHPRMAMEKWMIVYREGLLTVDSIAELNYGEE